jgi:hypothetical protein
MKLSGEEREYWRAVQAAVRWHCREHQVEKLDADAADDLRHEFTRDFLGQYKSHRDFDHEDYSAAIAWLRAYGEGGPIAAAAVDLAAVREESRRRRFFWAIDRRMGRRYCEPMARAAMHLAEFEAMDWQKVPTSVLAEIARAATTRRRSRDERGLSKARRSWGIANGAAATDATERVRPNGGETA